MEKLTEWFIGPYKVKRIISINVNKLELPDSIKIYLVVNVSRVQKYRDQVEGQKKKTTFISNNQRRRRIQGRENIK